MEEHIAKKHRKLDEFRKYPGEYDDAMKEDITKRTDALNDELATRQKSIDLLKGRLKNQITSFKEMIAKVIDKDTSLGERSELCLESKESLLLPYSQLLGWPSGYLLKHYYQAMRVQFQEEALASLLGKLGIKAAEALPGIIGGIISWILNRAKDVVGWVSQNLWALVVGIGGLIYMYMVTIK